MGESTISGLQSSNVLSAYRPAEVFSSGQTQSTVAGNQAGDEPRDFFTPSSLSSRSYDLFRLLDTVTNSVQTIRNATESIGKLKQLVNDAEALARFAQTLTPETANVTSSITGLKGTETLEAAFSIDATDAITIGDGAQNLTVTADGSITVQDLIEAVNADENLDVKASLSIQGGLKFEATGLNTITASLTDNAGAANTLNDLGFTDLGDGVIANVGTFSLNRIEYANNFDDFLTQIDETVKEAAFNGINLLEGNTLTVKFNIDNIPTIRAVGVDLDSKGLGITEADNYFQTDVDIRQSINELDKAAVTLANQSATFEANLAAIEINQDINPSLINALKTGSDLNIAPIQEQGLIDTLTKQTEQFFAETESSITSESNQDLLEIF